MTVLGDYITLDKLTVGRPVITPKSVKADYTVLHTDGTSSTNTLTYSYDRPMFDPGSPRDRNLASMMTAQVALNYGLFFRHLEFEGWFDRADVRHLLDMLENTSREIYVNKLLEPNEFIRESFRLTKAEKHERYTAADVIFRDIAPESYTLDGETDTNKYAILSSGGKDSLLCYGMVREFGEAHPVFINEAGRHWFTAVNAYRYYEKQEPNTVKPWCNSDRMFNWMVRQLPFIREDYARIRADIYPVRLWTVAVFLWGVLPVVLKRRIGNVLIGDEYDSTQRSVYSGITHYNALYDQSWYFDNALTRYYRKKNWGIRQFSPLRSLSELLILKVLVKRYPDLQRCQVSCHAANEKQGRMYPCGNCEKCRRIVGMLTALDEDPGRCGYSPEQVAKCLSALGGKGVKQIGSDAAHLYYMLLEKKKLEDTPYTRQMARPHPEILMLRFDRERSRLADLPDYVRKPLFGILSEYADGAAEWRDRSWHPVRLNDGFLEGPAYHLNEKSDERS